MIDVIFYEAFKEEEVAIKKFLPGSVTAQFTDKTIQENGDDDPPSAQRAPEIGIRLALGARGGQVGSMVLG